MRREQWSCWTLSLEAGTRAHFLLGVFLFHCTAVLAVSIISHLSGFVAVQRCFNCNPARCVEASGSHCHATASQVTFLMTAEQRHFFFLSFFWHISDVMIGLDPAFREAWHSKWEICHSKPDRKIVGTNTSDYYYYYLTLVKIHCCLINRCFGVSTVTE